MSIRSRIFEAMRRIAEEQQIVLPPLRDDMSLYETGFDSLAFAILVARLEDELGSDPLAADETALPSTIGDFVQVYASAAS
jgi:acyl carrier protein